MPQIKSIKKTAKSIAKLFESIDLYKKADKYTVLTPEFLKLSSGRKKITFSFIKKLSIALDDYAWILLEHEGQYIFIHHSAINEYCFEKFDFYHHYHITRIEKIKRCPDINLSNLIYYDEVLNNLSTMKELTIAEIRRRFMSEYLLAAAILQQLIIDGHKPTELAQSQKIKINQMADELIARLKFYEHYYQKMNSGCCGGYDGYSISSNQLKILSNRRRLTHHFINKLQKHMEAKGVILLPAKIGFTIMYEKTLIKYPFYVIEDCKHEYKLSKKIREQALSDDLLALEERLSEKNMYKKAKKLAIKNQKITIFALQKKLKTDFVRAATLKKLLLQDCVLPSSLDLHLN